MSKNINEPIKVCARIKRICEDDKYIYKESKQKLFELVRRLKSCQFKEVNEIKGLIDLHKGLGVIKNSKARYTEYEIASQVIVSLPISIIMFYKAISEDGVEELKSEYQNDNRQDLKMNSELLKYGLEIVSSKEEKSKRYKNRVEEAIRLLAQLQIYYKVNGMKEFFLSKINDKEKGLQIMALRGLENYYFRGDAEDLKKEEEDIIDQVLFSTEHREIAVTCCQILIYAGIIDELGAITIMDDWNHEY